jgi:hypothetical protein
MALAVVACVAWACPAAKAQPPVLNSVFNGTTLAGWNQVPAGTFEVNATDQAIETTGSARGYLYTTHTYSTYRVIYSVYQNLYLHEPSVLFFGSSDTADAMDGLQFELPTTIAWDYQPTGEYSNNFLPITGYNDGPENKGESIHVWYRCEMLVNTPNASADSACSFLNEPTTASHIMYFKNAAVPVENIPTPWAIQAHQTGVSDEYKDILIENNPTFDELVLLALPSPSAVTATAVSSSQIDLSWTINSTSQTGFEVFRSADNQTWTLVGTTTAGATAFSDTKLAANTTYYYRVAAVMSNAISDYATASANTAGGGATLIPDGTYIVTAVNSGLAIDDPDSSKTGGTDMQIYAVNDGANQQWTVNNLRNNVITLTNVASGQLLDVSGDSKAGEALIDQWPANGQTNQEWNVISVAGGAFELTSVNSGLALDVVDGGTTNGTKIDQYTYGGSAWQQWKFTTY